MSISENDQPFLSGMSAEKLFNGYYTPTTDVKETKDYFVVEIELPGVRSNDIIMEIGGGTLDIRGEHTEEKMHRLQHVKYTRKERVYGKFKKCIPISESISSNQVRATFRDGLLVIEISKPKQQSNTQKQKIKLI